MLFKDDEASQDEKKNDLEKSLNKTGNNMCWISN